MNALLLILICLLAAFAILEIAAFVVELIILLIFGYGR
jgi:hypothetical protein